MQGGNTARPPVPPLRPAERSQTTQYNPSLSAVLDAKHCRSLFANSTVCCMPLKFYRKLLHVRTQVFFCHSPTFTKKMRYVFGIVISIGEKKLNVAYIVFRFFFRDV